MTQIMVAELVDIDLQEQIIKKYVDNGNIDKCR